MHRRWSIGMLGAVGLMLVMFSWLASAQTDYAEPDLTIDVPGQVKHVSFSEDGAWVIVGYAPQNCLNCPGVVIDIYDIATGSRIYTFDYDEGTEDRLEVALSPDNEYLFAASYYLNENDVNQNRIAASRLWIVESGERLLPQDIYLINASWNPNNQLLLWYGETLMWIGQQILEITLDAFIQHAVWSPDFETVYAFTADGNFQHIDLRNAEILSTTGLATGEESRFGGFDGYYVYVIQPQMSEVWVVESGNPVKVYETGLFMGTAWLDNGYLLWDLGGSSFTVFDNASGEVVYSLNYLEELGHNGWMGRLDVYHDHVIYAITDAAGRPCPTYLYDMMSGETTTVNANFLTPHPNEPLVLTQNCEANEYLIYDLEANTVTATLALPEEIASVPLGNGQRIVAWGDETVYGWSIEAQ
ncbi:MAG: hypothetical protein L0154_00335 [Chloroflexi bacterium]|nr:hypothetical protein [Chloroflexota bacterium]